MGVSLFLLAGAASAQSLAEVAAREKERRAKKKATPKVYTNESLPKTRTPGEPSSAAETPPAESSSGGAEVTSLESQRAQWRQRAQDARSGMRKAEAKVQEIQERISALRLDREPTRVLDPNRLLGIQDDIRKAIEDLETAKGEVEKARKVIADLEDEARRARVPQGWLSDT